jgi:hypothetical protein
MQVMPTQPFILKMPGVVFYNVTTSFSVSQELFRAESDPKMRLGRIAHNLMHYCGKNSQKAIFYHLTFFAVYAG